ncbi:hypothetical protein HG530_002359 [Fusarium avenaceum]|nr:hypothetical protein HG530_002359 [Fusarium avenaceum]
MRFGEPRRLPETLLIVAYFLSFSLVTSSDDENDTLLGSVLDHFVEGIRYTIDSKRQVYHRELLSLLTDDVVDGPLNTVHDDGQVGRVALEHLDRDNIGPLSNAEGLANDDSSDVGSMAQTVSVILLESGPTVLGATLKFLVSDTNTTVDDVGKGAGTALLAVDIVSEALLAVRDGCKAPCAVLLVHLTPFLKVVFALFSASGLFDLASIG